MIYRRTALEKTMEAKSERHETSDMPTFRSILGDPRKRVDVSQDSRVDAPMRLLPRLGMRESGAGAAGEDPPGIWCAVQVPALDRDSTV